VSCALLLGLFRRIFGAAWVLLLVVTAVFLLLRTVPGGPFDAERELPPQALRAIGEYYRPENSFLNQYGHYLYNVLHGDLGPSYRQVGWSVRELLAEKMWVSFELGFYALTVAVGLGVLWGSAAAIRSRNGERSASMGLCTVLLCIPTFVLGPLANDLLAHRLHWFHTMGWEGWRCKVLPALVLGLIHGAAIARLTRQSMGAEYARPYVRTARAKGLGPLRVFCKHVFRNGIQPVVGYLGPVCAAVFSGTFVVENCFHIPGLGRLFIESIGNRDHTLIVGIVLLYAMLIQLCNLVADIFLGILNPRLR
jgi:oligopeptide transport system permease protein